MTQVGDVVEQWWQTFEQGDFDALMRLVGPEAEIVMPGGTRPPSRARRAATRPGGLLQRFS